MKNRDRIENWILATMAIALCAVSYQAVMYKSEITYLKSQMASHEYCTDWCVEQWTDYGC